MSSVTMSVAASARRAAGDAIEGITALEVAIVQLERERKEALQDAGRLRARVEELEAQPEIAEAVRRLDAIQGDADPEGELGEADQLVLACVPAEVRDAYRRLMERASWRAPA